MEENKEMKPKKKMNKGLKITLISISSFLGLILILASAYLIFCGATELKVEPEMAVSVNGTKSKALHTNEEIKVLTWNVGYCGLDEENDFFMDGGTKSYATSETKVKENMTSIQNKVSEINADLVMLQEVDVNSKRSWYVNQYESFTEKYKSSYKNTFALNYKAGLVPLPITQMLGKVESGILSLSKYDVREATRIQLPSPFSWPISMVNLKRCLLVNRIPVEGSTKELVFVNLHLEAYSDEAGKIEQANVLKQFIENEYSKGNYVVAGGDFNQTFSNIDTSMYPYREGDWDAPILDTTGFTNEVFVMDNTHPTCRLLNKPYKGADKSTFQYYMIDGFIYTKNITMESVNTLDLEFKNTDHNPVVMSIKLN